MCANIKVRTDLSILLRTNRTCRARIAEPNKQSEKKLGIFVAFVLFAAFPCSSIKVRTDLSILLRTNRTCRARIAEPNKQSEKKLGIFVAFVLFAAFPCSSYNLVLFSENAYGLCHVLSNPCPKPTPQMWDLGPTYKDKWEIPRDEIVLGRILGKGNFGEVYLGRWKDSKDVAVKTLKQGTMSTQAFLEEAAIMKKFRHNRLVALYGVCSKEEPIYIVQEYMRLGSLLDVLRKDQGKTLDFRDLIYIAAQIASGMKYLESKQLIHRDLAARNVLIGDNNTAKISDFGLARVMDDDQYQLKHNSRFPIKWTAPEVPYPGMTGPEVVELVLKGYRMPKPNNPKVTDDIYRTMLMCWDGKPENRPTFEFLTHYFEEFDVTTELPYKEVDY
ncbi:Protein tyrosine and serine/threonine kinase [Popillia japonica]|uniref:non-specific protein-tyrosine kinase n=1 Tax=Popillia japonica TaxID=7064 RepID=A0AAW1I8H0_POPJA